MRTYLTVEEQTLKARARSVRWHIEVKDAGGTFRNLATYPGRNFCVSAECGETVDSNGMDAQLEVLREVFAISAAGLMQDSPLNRQFSPGNSYAPLIEIGREVKVIAEVLPADQTDAQVTDRLLFHGYIDKVNDEADPIRLECRDLSAKLQDTWVEKERVYALASNGGAFANKRGLNLWEPSLAGIAVGDYYMPTDAKVALGKYFKATSITTGITGSTEPNWPGTGSVVDGGVTWTVEGDLSTTGRAVEDMIQAIVNDNIASSPPTVNIPFGSPGWALYPWTQDRVSTWEAGKTLSNQFGGDFRFNYHSAGGAFRLELLSPDRAKATVDWTFTVEDVQEVNRCERDIAGIRNAVQIVYSDAADPDPLGIPKRKKLLVTDSGSIAKYGRRFMEIAEEEDANINTAAEATTLANAILSDLADPNVELEVVVRLFPLVMLGRGDRYTFKADGLRFSVDQTLAVVGYRHRLTETEHTTSLQCRGKPSGGYLKWQELSKGRPKLKRHKTQVLASTGTTVSITSTVGGGLARVANAELKQFHAFGYEFHVSATSGFTPSSSTLIDAPAGKGFNFGHLIPGKTYYLRVVPIAENRGRRIRGQPSAEVSFVAGLINSERFFDPRYVPMATPPNGSFESWSEGSTVVPDNWAMVTGTWDTDIDQGADTAGGLASLAFNNTAVAAKIRSDQFPVASSALYRLGWWVKKSGTPDNSVEVAIEWYSEPGVLISTTTHTINLTSLGAGWEQQEKWVVSPSTARLARVYVLKSAASAYAFWVDEVVLEPHGSTKTRQSLSGVADGATAVAHRADTLNALATAGARLWEWATNGVIKLFVDKDGHLKPQTTDAVEIGSTANRFKQMVASAFYSVARADGFQIWKDTTPTKGAAIAMAKPGDAVGDHLAFSTFASSVWTKRLEIASDTGNFNLFGNAILQESWHVIEPAGTGGGEPDFENSWVNFDTSTYNSAAFFKDSFGVVHLRGLVKDGTVSTGSTGNIFTLPSGYRPAKNEVFIVLGFGAVAELHVQSDGAVRAWSGSNGAFQLDGVTFRAA